MKKYLLLIFLTLIIGSSLFAESIQNNNSIIEESQVNNSLNIIKSTIKNPIFSTESIMKAYMRAYPDRITDVDFRNNKWAFKLYGTWYYWAEGKLLPWNLLPEEDSYSSYSFYNYPKHLPVFQELSNNQKDRIESFVEKQELEPMERNPALLNALWRIYDKKTSWERVKTTFFLGFKLQIHRELLEDLARVEEEIQKRMLVDNELKNFIETLYRIDGYNWRQIAETNTLSVHSYGIALDLILKRTNNKAVYWVWSKNTGINWYDIPYSNRFSPPETFVEAFEKHGFVWGGKWLFFDTIHFEYRPEILYLNSILKD